MPQFFCCNGSFPCSAASRSDGLEIVKLLVENGADVNIRGFLGRTPLIEAFDRAESYPITAYLPAAGAETGTIDDNGLTAYGYARRIRNYDPTLLEALKPWQCKTGLP